ncbi:unnamed protein product [Prorocentrum cordatum]|nr:unnamed protein product [Polarella glacialis]
MCLLNMHHFDFIWLWLVSLSMCSTIYLGAASPLEDCLTGRGERAGRVLMATVVLTFFVACLYHSFYLAVSCDMEANVSRNELKAARSVLRGVCDVVVELDSDFRLQDGCPELADLLLLNPRRPLLGEDLRQFLASQQDRKKFSEQLGKVWLLGEDEVGLSAAFHVSMKDSSSIPLDVEVFCVRFVNREGLAAYFVGVREFTDTAPMVRDSASERTRPGGRLRGPPSACTAHFMPPAAPADSTAPASSQASSDVSSESCSLDASWEDPGAEVEPVAWVDVLTPNYSVRLETPAFTEHVDARGELLTAMRQSQQSEFASWAQEAYFALLEEGAASAHQQYHRRLHFRSFAQQGCALGPRPSRRLPSALLRLDLTRPPDGQDLGRGVVRIVLQDILLGQRPALAGGAAPPEAAGGPAQREGAVSRPPSCGPAAQPSQAVGLGKAARNL